MIVLTFIKMSVLFGGWGVNIYPTFFNKSSWNFLPIFWGCGLQNVSWWWWKLWKTKNWNWYRGKVLFSRAFPPLHLTYIRVGTKLLTKNSWKTYVSLCSLWKKATLFFLTPAVDIFRLLLKNTVTIVLGTTFWPSTLWFSQVKLQHPIIYERAL